MKWSKLRVAVIEMVHRPQPLGADYGQSRAFPDPARECSCIYVERGRPEVGFGWAGGLEAASGLGREAGGGGDAVGTASLSSDILSFKFVRYFRGGYLLLSSTGPDRADEGKRSC